MSAPIILFLIAEWNIDKCLAHKIVWIKSYTRHALANAATITLCPKIVKGLLFSLFTTLIAAGEISGEIHEGIGLEGKEIGCDDKESSQVEPIMTHSSVSSTEHQLRC